MHHDEARGEIIFRAPKSLLCRTRGHLYRTDLMESFKAQNSTIGSDAMEQVVLTPDLVF